MTAWQPPLAVTVILLLLHLHTFTLIATGSASECVMGRWYEAEDPVYLREIMPRLNQRTLRGDLELR